MSFSETEITIAITGFIKDNILADGVELANDTLLESLGIDSFSLIEIFLFIERKFGVVLPDSELTAENVKSVASLSAAVVRQITRHS